MVLLAHRTPWLHHLEGSMDMDHTTKPIIVVTELAQHLARFEPLKFRATLQVEEGDSTYTQGVNADDAINQLLTILALRGWSANRHDYDIRIK